MYIFLRIIAAIFMLCLVAWGYWWFTLIVAIFFLFHYNKYYEIILWGICFDALYGLNGKNHLATILAIALFFIGTFLKKRLSLYS